MSVSELQIGASDDAERTPCSEVAPVVVDDFHRSETNRFRDLVGLKLVGAEVREFALELLFEDGTVLKAAGTSWDGLPLSLDFEYKDLER